jgi:ankyrin repeat protein
MKNMRNPFRGFRTMLEGSTLSSNKSEQQPLLDQPTQKTLDDNAKSLINALQDGDLDKVNQLLNDGKVNINFKGDKWITPLIVASQKGYSDVVEQLLGAGANLDLADKDGKTALMFASVYGYSEVVEQLLKAGANPDYARKDGVTALMLASQEGHYKVVEQLLEKKANVDLFNKDGVTALMLASGQGHCKVVEQLLGAEANVNLATKDHNRFTALILASGQGHSDVVEKLIVGGANIDSYTGFRKTNPLLSACQHGHPDVVAKLINKGADLKVENNGSETPLFVACKHNNPISAYLLFLAGANVDCLEQKAIFSNFKSIREELTKIPEMTKCIKDILDSKNLQPDAAKARIEVMLRQLPGFKEDMLPSRVSDQSNASVAPRPMESASELTTREERPSSADSSPAASPRETEGIAAQTTRGRQ